MGREFAEMMQQAMNLLEQESQLVEIVRLVGAESISAQDRMTLETAKSIREDFLHQNAFHKTDTFTPIEKQHEMIKLILHFHQAGLTAIANGVDTADIFVLSVREDIARCKYIDNDQVDQVSAIKDIVDKQVKELQAAVSA